MKNKTHYVAFSVILLFLSSQSFAEEEEIKQRIRDSYPTLSEQYENCRKAVTEPGRYYALFLKSSCSTYISGYLAAINGVIGRLILAGDNWQQPSADTIKLVNDLRQNSFCAPFKQFPKNVPHEFSIARDFIVHYEVKLEKSRFKIDFMQEPAAIQMGEILKSMYPCKGE